MLFRRLFEQGNIFSWNGSVRAEEIMLKLMEADIGHFVLALLMKD